MTVTDYRYILRPLAYPGQPPIYAIWDLIERKLVASYEDKRDAMEVQREMNR
jgi:hypothetical protein